ncbi:hypothetical protein D8674_013000 [Pyrus ussuriensis x Pyrus communis]|uniref:Transcription termination factor MTERF6 n=1 Tax=Pyrus ussuriensis x Pyrus communis TaxID=2448454 RepID=A0A5N5GT99_9ROSA|nr:hypothetical protein D8674_013000 [Pyrus ussuriensis x Pyrus communis]
MQEERNPNKRELARDTEHTSWHHHLVRIPVELNKPPLCHSISLLFYSSSRLEKPKSKSKISVSEYLITQHQFSPEAALKAASTIAFLKSPADSSSVISFLRESGFSKTHMEDVVKRVPRILTSNLDTVLKPKFKVFQDLGFSDSDIVDIVSSDPWILWRSADNRLAPALLVLKKILGSNARVLKALKLPGWFLKYNLEKTMMSNVEVLQSYGIKLPQIIKYIFQFPRFFVHKPESIVEVVKRVDEMGFDMKSKRFLSAIRIMTSLTVDTWERKVKLFKSLGLSEDDISAVFRRVPQVFAVSENKIKEVAELLLSTGKFDISFIEECMKGNHDLLIVTEVFSFVYFCFFLLVFLRKLLLFNSCYCRSCYTCFIY